MRRRDLCNALVFPILAGGCVRRDFVVSSAAPPAGAVIAHAMYPALGASWKLRRTERALFHESVDDEDIAAAAVSFNGRGGYGLTRGTAIRVLDPVTFNTLGTLAGGTVVSVNTPGMGPFSWPLWVGKAWDVTYAHADFVTGRVWTGARAELHVAAIEDVTVPAGTFTAFRIACRAGIGTESSGGRRDAGVTGIGSASTYWYAPSTKLVVKSVKERSGMHYRGAGRTMTELLRTPA